jgi:hypothetical protein
MKIAVLVQAYGRFGGAERTAFLHYLEMKRSGSGIFVNLKQ